MQISRDEAILELKHGIVHLTFEKKDGTIREMNATLHPNYLPPMVEREPGAAERKINPGVVAVWDMDIDDWRAFRLDSLKTFEVQERID